MEGSPRVIPTHPLSKRKVKVFVLIHIASNVNTTAVHVLCCIVVSVISVLEMAVFIASVLSKY